MISASKSCVSSPIDSGSFGTTVDNDNILYNTTDGVTDDITNAGTNTLITIGDSGSTERLMLAGTMSFASLGGGDNGGFVFDNGVNKRLRFEGVDSTNWIGENIFSPG